MLSGRIVLIHLKSMRNYSLAISFPVSFSLACLTHTNLPITHRGNFNTVYLQNVRSVSQKSVQISGLAANISGGALKTRLESLSVSARAMFSTGGRTHVSY